MQFALSQSATWTWEKCLNSCNRIGKDVCITFKKSSVTFISTNATNNCYILLCFGNQFFERVNGADEANDAVIKGIIPVFFLLKSFRNLRNFQLRKTMVTVDQKGEMFKIALYSKHGVTRTHTFRFHCGEIQSPVPVSWQHRHFLISTPSQLKLILEQFRGAPLSRTSVKLPMSSNPLTGSHESSLLSFATEDIVFQYDKEMDGILIQTYKEHFCASPKVSSPVSRDEPIAKEHTHTTEFRLPNSKYSCTMLTKALLPRTFFETLYIDTHLNELAPNELICFDSDPLQCVCDLGENLSSQLCLTWHRAGDPLIATLGDNFAIGNSNLLFNFENSQTSCFNSFESIQEVASNEKKLSLFHWTGVLWMNSTLDICKEDGTQTTEQRFDTIPAATPQCTGNKKSINLTLVASQCCTHKTEKLIVSPCNTTPVDPSIYEPTLETTNHSNCLSNLSIPLKDGLNSSRKCASQQSPTHQGVGSHPEPCKPSLCVSEDTFKDLIELDCLPDCTSPKELNCSDNDSDQSMCMNKQCYDSSSRESQGFGNFITPRPTHNNKGVFCESGNNPFSWNKTSFDTFADAFTLTDSSTTMQTTSFNLQSSEFRDIAADRLQQNPNLLKNKMSRSLPCEFNNVCQKKACASISQHSATTLHNNSSNLKNDTDQWFDELDLW